jgi:antitoxin component of RelBE/YafQ-DinJ toxin-antitoxin module
MPTKYHNVQTRVDDTTFMIVDEFLKNVGISKSQLILALFKQVALKNKIPFEIDAFTSDSKNNKEQEIITKNHLNLENKTKVLKSHNAKKSKENNNFHKMQSKIIEDDKTLDNIPKWDDSKLKPFLD